MNNSISTIAIRRHIGTLALTTTAIVLGIFFISQIQVDLLPAITYPRIGVRLNAPGVSPEVAVEEITKPLERALSVTEGVTQIYSQTREGRVSVNLYFEAGEDIEQALNDATVAFNRVRGRLPNIVDNTRVFKFDPSGLPVYEFALKSDSLKDVDLRVFADRELAKELSVIPGVGSVDVSGGVTEEIRVEIDPDRLQVLGIGLNEILQKLGNSNRDISGGRLSGGEETLTRLVGRFQSVEDIENIAFNVGNNEKVYLRDFSTIIDGTAEQKVFVSLNGESAVKVSVQKQPDANSVRVVEKLEEKISELKESGLISEDIELQTTLNESIFIRNSIANVSSAGLIGSSLAALTVLLFLGSLRQTFIIVTAIPLAVFMAIVLMRLFGLSLNVFSLGGLALGVGIVVDNAIVMLETISDGVNDRLPNKDLSIQNRDPDNLDRDSFINKDPQSISDNQSDIKYRDRDRDNNEAIENNLPLISNHNSSIQNIDPDISNQDGNINKDPQSISNNQSDIKYRDRDRDNNPELISNNKSSIKNIDPDNLDRDSKTNKDPGSISNKESDIKYSDRGIDNNEHSIKNNSRSICNNKSSIKNRDPDNLDRDSFINKDPQSISDNQSDIKYRDRDRDNNEAIENNSPLISNHNSSIQNIDRDISNQDGNINKDPQSISYNQSSFSSDRDIPNNEYSIENNSPLISNNDSSIQDSDREIPNNEHSINNNSQPISSNFEDLEDRDRELDNQKPISNNSDGFKNSDREYSNNGHSINNNSQPISNNRSSFQNKDRELISNNSEGFNKCDREYSNNGHSIENNSQPKSNNRFKDSDRELNNNPESISNNSEGFNKCDREYSNNGHSIENNSQPISNNRSSIQNKDRELNNKEHSIENDSKLIIDRNINSVSNIDKKNLSPSSLRKSVEDSSRSIESALIASTTTNLVSVLPFLLIGGLFSLLFRELILTISFAVASSLLIAITVIPMLASRLLGINYSSSVSSFFLLRNFNNAFAYLNQRYYSLLKFVLKKRLLIICLAFIILGGSSIILGGQLKREILPRINTGQVRLIARFSPGTSLATNRQVMKLTDDILLKQPETKSVFTSSGGFIFASTTIENILRGSSTISLKPGTNVESYIEKVQQEFQKLNLVDTRLRLVPERVRGINLSNSPINAEIDVTLKSEDTEVLEKTGKEVLKILDENVTLSRFNTDNDPKQPEIKIYPDRLKVEQLSLNNNEIGQALQTAISGNVPTQLQRNNRLIDIKVQLKDNIVRDISQLSQLPLLTGKNNLIRLQDIAEIIPSSAPQEIKRINQQQVYLIAGSLKKDAILGEAISEINTILNKIELPDNVTISNSAVAKTNKQLQNALKILGGLATFLVFVVMAVQYNSLIDPLVIMLTIPLALAGGIWGLYLTKTAIGATVLVGAVLLIGIVVNNAIVMVELANQIYTENTLDRRQAILKAASQRLRPILMTTITTVLGLFPLALGIGEGSEFLQPLGVVVFSGLSLATLLTLFLIPCFYTLLHDLFNTKLGRKSYVP